MTFTTLPTTKIGSLKAIVQDLWQLIQADFDDHDSRLNALEAVGSAPVGTIAEWTAAAMPTGWIECDGSTVSQTTYADLFAVYGTTFNTGGEGAGNFRLPDMRGRFAMGSGTGLAQDLVTPLTARGIGTKVGEQDHVLLTAELPSHTHTVTDPGHTMDYKLVSGAGAVVGQNPVSDATSTSDIRTTSNATGITLNNAGGDTGHNTVQPFLVMKVMVKY